jgi:hypothetical protein
LEILRKRRGQREKVIREAREWASGFPLKATVILVGSYARRDFNLWSDVDLVLVSELEGNPLERLMRIRSPPGYEVVPLTPGEFLAQADKRNPLILEAICGGVVLRDDYRLLESGSLKRRHCGRYGSD